MGHAAHKGGVRAGADGNPFVGNSGGIGVAGVNNHDAGVALLLCLHEIVGHAAAAHARFYGIVAKKDRKLGVGNVAQRIVAQIFAVHEGHGLADLGGAVRAVHVQITAKAVHQARQRGIARGPGDGKRGAEVARAVVDVDGVVAVVGNGLFEPGGNFVQRLLPRNALKFAFAASANALHGVLEPVGSV